MPDMIDQRLARLRQRMQETKTDLIAVGPGSHMQWLLDLNPHGDERPVMALVTSSGMGVLMPRLNADAARAKCPNVPFFTWSDSDGPDAALASLLSEIGATTAGQSVVLDETMRTDFAFLLLGQLEAPRHRFTGDTLAILRAEKDEQELDILRKSARLNDDAFEVAFAALRTGMTECDLRDIIVSHYAKHGAEAAFCTVAFGANSALPHHHTGQDTLMPDMAVLIDAGCRLQGYPSDMTRCAWYGETADPKFLELSEIVENAVQAAETRARPGVLCSAVDRAARQVIEDAGYGNAFLHRTGHGLGVDVHEPPYIAANSDIALARNNVFSIEPGIYLQGVFGVRLEDVVVQLEDRAEVLSGMPRTVRILPVRS